LGTVFSPYALQPIEQWFSNVLSLLIPFTAPKTAADPFFLSIILLLLRNYIWSLLRVISSTAPSRSKFQVSGCRQLKSPKSN